MMTTARAAARAPRRSTTAQHARARARACACAARAARGGAARVAVRGVRSRGGARRPARARRTNMMAESSGAPPGDASATASARPTPARMPAAAGREGCGDAACCGLDALSRLAGTVASKPGGSAPCGTLPTISDLESEIARRRSGSSASSSRSRPIAADALSELKPESQQELTPTVARLVMGSKGEGRQARTQRGFERGPTGGASRGGAARWWCGRRAKSARPSRGRASEKCALVLPSAHRVVRHRHNFVTAGFGFWPAANSKACAGGLSPDGEVDSRGRCPLVQLEMSQRSRRGTSCPSSAAHCASPTDRRPRAG